MGKFSKHIGEAQEVEIDGEKFHLKPLTVESLPNFFKVMKAMSGAANAKEGDLQAMFSNLNDEGLQALKDIIKDTLEISYPDEDARERSIFALKYMMELFTAIMELNSSSLENSNRGKQKSDIIKRLKSNVSKSDSTD